MAANDDLWSDKPSPVVTSKPAQTQQPAAGGAQQKPSDELWSDSPPQVASAQQRALPAYAQPNRPPAEDMPLEEVVSRAKERFLPSVGEQFQGLYHAVTSPVETGKALGALGTGAISKAKGALGFKQDEGQKAQDEAAINALGSFYADRYGSMAGFKRALAEDPASVLMDLSIPFTGGGGALAKAPGMVGTAGKVLKAAGTAMDPIALSAEGLKQGTRLATTAASVPAVWSTGASWSSLNKAAQAGLEGNKNFLSHLMGTADPADAVRRIEDVRSVLAERRSQDIQKVLGNIGDTPMNYQPVLDSVQEAMQRVAPHGTSINKAGYEALQEVAAKINEFMSNPRITPNVQNFQNLKVAVRDIMESGRLDQQGKNALNHVYHSIRDQIGALPNDVGKKYMDAMDVYAKQSKELQELQQAFLQGRGDAAKIRKILSTKDNVLKKNMLDEIAKIDPEIPYIVAGMELNPAFPKGLVGMLSGVASGAGGFMFGVPHGIAAAAAHSPRVVGGTLYGTGYVGGAPARLVEAVPGATQVPIQAMRTEEMQRGREGRATGGRAPAIMTAERLLRAAHAAKLKINKTTEQILDQPDEAVVKALDIAQRHI